MKKTDTRSVQITGLESNLATRDCAWAFAFPMTFHHQWMREEEFIAQAANNRRWEDFGRQHGGHRRRFAGRVLSTHLSLARQPQDFSDVFWALSLPASGTDGAAIFVGS